MTCGVQGVFWRVGAFHGKVIKSDYKLDRHFPSGGMLGSREEERHNVNREDLLGAGDFDPWVVWRP